MNRITINQENCKECGYCMHFCPKKVVLKKDTLVNSKGYYPVCVAEQDECVACGICATMCPEGAIKVEKDV